MGTALASNQSTSSIQLLLLVYKALNTGTPPYLAALITRKSFCRVPQTSQKVNILDVPAHSKGRHSLKAFFSRWANNVERTANQRTERIYQCRCV